MLIFPQVQFIYFFSVTKVANKSPYENITYMIVNLTKGENIINVVFWKQLASDEFVDIFYLIIAPDISELLNDDSRW